MTASNRWISRAISWLASAACMMKLQPKETESTDPIWHRLVLPLPIRPTVPQSLNLRSPSCSTKYICIDSTGPLLRLRGTVCIAAGRGGRSVDASTKPSLASRSFATGDAGVEIALCLLCLLVSACRLTRLIRGKPLWRDKRMRFGVEDP